MRETCKKEDIKAFLTLKIKKHYTLWKMADSFVKNISALFLQGFEIGFKKTLERGKYMKKENGVTKQVGKKLNFWQKLWKYRVLTLMCVPAMIFFFAFNYMPFLWIPLFLATTFLSIHGISDLEWGFYLFFSMGLRTRCYFCVVPKSYNVSPFSILNSISFSLSLFVQISSFLFYVFALWNIYHNYLLPGHFFNDSLTTL